MKRWKKIVLGVFAVLLLATAAVGIWQWKNIQAAFIFLTQDSQQIAENLEQKREEHQQAIQKYAQITVIPPSTEHSNAILSGEKTPEQVKEELGITKQLEKIGRGDKTDWIANGESADDPSSVANPEGASNPGSVPSPGSASNPESVSSPGSVPSPASTANPESPAPTVSVENVEELTNSCVAELYGCKVDVMAMLGELKQEAVDQWLALPPEEWTETKKKEIGFAGLNRCYDLEEKVDAQVRDILADYRPLLETAGGDPSILDALWDYYCEEKVAEKAYYMDKYLNG